MPDVPEGKVDVVIRVRMDEEKLDAYVRGLYDDDETVPGEPRVGVHLVRDLAVANSRGDHFDSIWITTDNPYVESFVIAVIPGG